MTQSNTSETPNRVASACPNLECSTCYPSVEAVLEQRRQRIKLEDQVWEAQIHSFVTSAGQSDVRRVALQAADEHAIQELHYAEAMANPHLYQFSVREQLLAPDPSSVRTGLNEVALDDDWFQDDGVDIRILRGRDLRYWLLRFLDQNNRRGHKISRLREALTDAGFKIVGRPSKTISDALHTETDRGRVVRTAWGEYQIAKPLAPTSRRRINERIEYRRQTLSRRIAQIGDRIETLWTRTLRGSDHWVMGRQLPGMLGYFTTPTIRIHCAKVASPTDKTKNTHAHGPLGATERLDRLDFALHRVTERRQPRSGC